MTTSASDLLTNTGDQQTAPEPTPRSIHCVEIIPGNSITIPASASIDQIHFSPASGGYSVLWID